jgi:hypothetical protein
MDYSAYLELVSATARKNLKPGATSITAAALGALLRQAAPDVTFRMFDRHSLLEVIGDIEAKGLVRQVETEKGALAVEPTNGVGGQTVEPVAKFNPVRKTVWEAFVLAVPAGKRFMHRRTGSIRAGLDVAPSPADEWVEIKPITSAVQKTWAQEFLRDSTSGEQKRAQESLVAINWHVQDFTKALKEDDELAVRKWNRFRSAQVSSSIQEWLTTHSLPVDFGFQTDTPTISDHGAASLEGTGVGLLPPEDMRRVILAALATLPLDKLLEIPVPAGSILAALQKTRTR